MGRPHLNGLSAGGQKVTSVADPTAPTDGANKQYVDASVGGWTYVVSTVDTPNSTVTAANITGLALSNLADGLYDVEFLVLGTTASVSTGIQVGLTFGASAPFAGFMWGVGASGSAHVFRSVASDELTSAYLVALGASRATPGINPAAFGTGVVRAVSMSTSIQLTVRSEVAASQVIAKADSYIRYRRIAS